VNASVSALKDQYEDQLWRLNNIYWIVDKSGKRVPFRLNSSQENMYHEMHYRNVVLKARQRGFTTFLDIFGLDSCVFNPDFAAGIIAHNLNDVEKIFRTKVKFPYENLPEGIRSAVHANSDRTNEYVFSNGSSIGVGTSYRSGTLQFLHVSEFGKIAATRPDKAKEIITGALEAVPKDGIAAFESTAEGDAGAFYDMVESAMDKKGQSLSPIDFKFFFEPWWNNDEYSMDHEKVISDKMAAYFDDLLEKHDIHLTRGQKSWYIAKAGVLGEDMKREYPATAAEAFEVALDGAFYANQMIDANQRGRVANVPYDPALPVITSWDLGMADSTCIFFWQVCISEIRAIDIMEFTGTGLPEIIKQIDLKPYNYSQHIAPHDIAVRELGTGKSRKEVASKLGLKFDVAPNLPVNDGIEAVKAMLPRVYFDREKCADGIRALKNYRSEYNEIRNVFSKTPRHDWTSHYADAVRYFAVTKVKGQNGGNTGDDWDIPIN